MPNYSHYWLCRRIVEDSRDAIIFADAHGLIRLWNAGAETVFGFPAGEALGQSLDLIIPENLRARHWEGFRQTMATGVTQYAQELLAVPALRKDGARISVEFTIVMVRDEAGALLGTAAILRDVTARWERDKQLRQRLADLEAQLARRQESQP